MIGFYYFGKVLKTKNLKCCFQQWNPEVGKMETCGKLAIGSRGKSGKYPLCKSHFEYCAPCIDREKKQFTK